MYPPHHAGGYEVMWQAAVRHARRVGHSVRVLTSDYRHLEDIPETDPDVHRTLRWYWDLHRYDFPQLTPTQRLRHELHNKRELQRHLREFRPDVVSWWSMGCISLSLIELVRRQGLPAAFVVHDDWLVYGPGYDQWIRMWRGRRRLVAPIVELLFGLPTAVDLARSGRFVFNSSYTLEAARRAGTSPELVSVVPPGIEPDLQHPLESAPWRWRLLYIGRLDRQKGIDTAIEALAQLPPEATLDVWGTGQAEYLAEMRRLVGRLGLGERVRFRGWAGPVERLRAYRDADVVVFPVRWKEPFGLVPLEAMGTGRLVVSTAQGGSAEFLSDGQNALLFQPDDVAALASAVRRLGASQELRQRLLSHGRQTASAYTLERFARDTVSQIEAAAPA
jgi:glycosyltransferase involved in cell wall biosynthesis